MGNSSRLVELGNSELLAGLSELVRQSNVLTAQVLAHLVELEERLLHLELGFSSLFAYCVEALGMSEGAAGRRVTATRVCRRFPDALDRVARGELHLCALCALASHLNAENAAELFAACMGKTRRQIEELLAARFPRPEVREQIRRLPVRRQGPIDAAKPMATATHPLPTTRPADEPASPATVPEVPTNSPNPAPPPIGVTVSHSRLRARELEPLSADRFGVHFTADRELRDLIERARALASHRLPNGDLASLMKLMAASFVRQEEKRRFGIEAGPRRGKTATDGELKPARCTERRTPPGEVSRSSAATASTTGEVRGAQVRKRGRYLSVAVRRDVHDRDHGRCSFVSADGRRCTGRTFLEFDHVKPFARFGTADPRNLRLLCRAHNLLHARNCFGAMHLAAKLAAKKVSCSRDKRAIGRAAHTQGTSAAERTQPD